METSTHNYDIANIRRRRLAQVLYERYDNKKTNLAVALGLTTSSYLSRPFSSANPRNIGNYLARKIEEVSGLPAGWMDMPYPSDIKDSEQTRNKETHVEGDVALLPQIHLDSSDAQHRVSVMGDTMNGPAADNDEVKQTAEWINFSISNKAYGLRIRGSDLWPRLREGELLLINPSANCVPGDIVTVKNAKDGFLIRDLVSHYNGEILLDPINGNGPRKNLLEEEIDYMDKVQAIMPGSLIEK